MQTPLRNTWLFLCVHFASVTRTICVAAAKRRSDAHHSRLTRRVNVYMFINTVTATSLNWCPCRFTNNRLNDEQEDGQKLGQCLHNTRARIKYICTCQFTSIQIHHNCQVQQLCIYWSTTRQLYRRC